MQTEKFENVATVATYSSLTYIFIAHEEKKYIKDVQVATAATPAT